MSDDDIDGYFSTARVSAREEAIELPPDDFRANLYPVDSPQFTQVRGMNFEQFAQDRYRAPFLRELLEYWDGLYREPFVGVTSDGVVREGLYALPEGGRNDPELVAAAERLMGLLTPGERDQLGHPIDAPQWRAWSNPEFMVYRIGLRLECLADEKVEAILEVVRRSLSPEGYQRVRQAMELNGFLGRLVELPEILNARSYWFAIFGTPSQDEPWGWQLSGHHVDVNFVTIGGRELAAPVFIGAEPALSDDEHPPLFAARERAALELAGSLTEAQRAEAVVYDSVLDPRMPEGRIHPADERHLAGAFRDNRVIPYEGINAAALDARQRELLRELVADCWLLLRVEQRAAQLDLFDAHLDETWFAWYGATDGSQPYYFRIQSPVIVAELDDHAGVWLANRLPARFHVHTTLRVPNGNDYGKAYLAQWQGRQDS
ncbi:DUF3500 domain-containing protein [Gryllotalpicola ginsengisoli]|uniref:DUF3500 domain-containing protein n=1 Tax=Gryllotalpicola ginsengisoli TaxID=444608 RepID=UPI0003B4C050|nr:DUF3500 domain-containing protein [Gryllotalpicola ginsengisoli]